MIKSLNNRKIALILTLVCLVAIPLALKSWWAVPTLNTHNSMTSKAIGIIEEQKGQEYPDIIRFKGDIIEGSANMVADATIIHNAKSIIGWGKYGFDYKTLSQDKWDASIIPNYQKGYILGEQKGYWWLGNIAHLVEDMAAPPHSLRAHVGYRKSPDAFENAAAERHIVPDTNTYYHDGNWKPSEYPLGMELELQKYCSDNGKGVYSQTCKNLFHFKCKPPDVNLHWDGYKMVELIDDDSVEGCYLKKWEDVPEADQNGMTKELQNLGVNYTAGFLMTAS